MCTLAWGGTSREWWLCFNRDERRLRARAEPPRRTEVDGVPVLAPRDPEGGGSWFSVNAHGVALALLNRYEAGAAKAFGQKQRRSRGLLLMDLAAHREVTQVREALKEADLNRYEPFHLLALQGAAGGHFRTDSIHGCRSGTAEAFLTTSSYKATEVTRLREQFWSRFAAGRTIGLTEAAEALRSRNPGFPAAGLCMDREDARTVSQLQLQVGAGKARVAYYERSGSVFAAPREMELSLTVPA